jgi:hypothetical protein
MFFFFTNYINKKYEKYTLLLLFFMYFSYIKNHMSILEIKLEEKKINL